MASIPPSPLVRGKTTGACPRPGSVLGDPDSILFFGIRGHPRPADGSNMKRISFLVENLYAG